MVSVQMIFGGLFCYLVYILGVFLVKQLFHSHLLDMRWLLRALLAIYHLKSNARSWNNLQITP